MGKRKKIFISIILILIISSAVIVTLYKNQDMTTHTVSWSFDSKERKIVFLKKYLVTYSDILDTEYRIDYWGNSLFSVGPSEWDISVAIKVNNNDVDKWIKDYDRTDIASGSSDWVNELHLNKQVWILNTVPEYYKNNNDSYMIVYRDEGIIYKRIIST